jgi:Zn-dependent M16 (insulinase) family peptidase
VSYPYPFGKNEDPEKKCQVTVAWLTADIKDTFEVLTLVLLENILLGNSASPLRKALIDSRLGTTLCDGTGFVPEHRDTMFACGLKDVKESDAEKIESIIFDVLNHLVKNGIDKNQIESAIHQIEFHRKEVTNHPYPYGIKLLLFFAGSWFHGGDPVRTFQFDVDLERLRDELTKDSFFENQIKKYFLENPHRVLFTLVPDQLMEEKENRRVDEELNRLQSKMRPSDLEKVNQDAEALRQRQETNEDVSRLPTLSIDDIPPEIQIVKETRLKASTPAACYQRPTAGIFYFAAAAGIHSLPERFIYLVPFFCHAFSRIGTTRRDYMDMAQRISMFTGGVSLSANARTRFNGTGACVPFVSLNGKCLIRNQERMFEIITELLGEFNFSDMDRLRNLLLEYRAGMEANIVHNGHRLAMSLASRNFSITNRLHEIWHGIHQLQTIKGITDDLSDDKLVSIADDLAFIGKTLFHRKNLKMALIGEEPALLDGISNVKSVQMALDEGERDDFGLPEISTGNDIPREGWSTATAVSFVACTFETVRMVHEDAPVLAVISKMLRSLYLHREIREKGGAYGGLATYNPEDGIFSLASYRDPNIDATLNVYARAMSFIKSDSYSDEDIKEAILQVCSEIDKPDPPGPAARKAFYRKIISLTDDARERFKNRLLTLTRRQVRAVAQKHFDPGMDKKAVVVISNEEKLKAANEKLGPKRLELHRI